VLEWEKSETEKEISETTKAFEWEIDISRLYAGLEPKTNYRLASMVRHLKQCRNMFMLLFFCNFCYGLRIWDVMQVGCDEKQEHICIAYEKNRWVNLRRDALAGEVSRNSSPLYFLSW